MERDDDPQVINSRLLEDLGEVNMSDPSALAEFVKWATQSFPAQHYLLVLWDHGTGWMFRRPRRKVRAVLFDDTSGDEMTIPELAEGLAQAGLKLDLIAFDACLMQMMEVAYEVREWARYLAGSEENEPYEGLPYDDILSQLAENPSLTPEQLGKLMVDAFIEEYDETGWTYSLVNLSAMDEVAEKLDQLAQALSQAYEEHKDEILSAIRNTQHFDQTYGNGTYQDYRDLWHFALLAQEKVGDEGVKDAASQLAQALEEVVVYSRYRGDSMRDARGLSIFLPDNFSTLPEKKATLQEYRSLSLAQTQWDEFLALLPVGRF